MTLPGASPESLGFHAERLQHVAHWLDHQVAHRRVAGASVMLSRRGQTALFHSAGVARLASEEQRAQDFDRQTLVRLYSMTKPVTAVAAMMLYEEGHFQLEDPVAWYLPAFADTPVWDGSPIPGEAGDEHWRAHLQPQQSPMTIRHLLTHTAGLSYSFMHATLVDQRYRDKGLEFPGAKESLAVLVDRLAEQPLLFQPGSRWHYSVASDVLGRLVEIWSGESLDSFFQRRIFAPLGMHDTAFHAEGEERQQRLADLMTPASGGDLAAIGATGGTTAAFQRSGSRRSTAESLARGLRHEPPQLLEPGAHSTFRQPPALLSGGGGLVGTIDDYARFLQMLLQKGELDGERLLAPATVAFMQRNHLPGQGDMASLGQAQWSESSYEGIGFGLGHAVVIDPVKAQMICAAGECHWGGAASTFFWLDPVSELQVIFLAQLFPSSSYPMRRELRTAVYQAALDMPASFLPA